MLDQIRPGDVVIVTKYDRLSRSLKDLLNIVEVIRERGAGFKSLAEDIDTTTPAGRLVFHVFASISQFERERISERTKEGIAAARARGKVIGRPKGALGKSKLDGKEEDIQLLLKKEVGIASIAKIMGVSRTALRHFIRTRKLS